MSKLWLRCAVLVSLVSLVSTGASAAAEISGKVSLVRKGKPSRLGDLRDAIVWFEPNQGGPNQGGPNQGGATVAPRTEPHLMSTKDKEFEPHILVVQRGESVRFPNRDPILHNVFSVSGRNSFDLGFYKTGPGETVVFREASLVRVFCNVHHAMVAYVLVVDTPFHTRADESGKFVLRGIPEGGGTIHVWHERADPVELKVAARHSAPLSIEIEVTRPRVPQHTNKHGRSYGPTSSYE